METLLRIFTCQDCNGYVMYGNAEGDYTLDVRPSRMHKAQNGALQIIGADVNKDGLTDLITGLYKSQGYYVGHLTLQKPKWRKR